MTPPALRGRNRDPDNGRDLLSVTDQRPDSSTFSPALTPGKGPTHPSSPFPLENSPLTQQRQKETRCPGCWTCSHPSGPPPEGLIPEQPLSPTHGGGHRGPTLHTNISPRKRATVLKLPSQMLGLAPGVAGRSPRGGRGGLGWRSCFLSVGEWILRTGSVGRGLVGSRGSAGGPGERGCALG